MTDPLRVWAPFAREVSLVVDGRARAMTPEASGFFVADAPDHGADYFVRIDGRDRPDPRSRWQPTGISGPSKWIAPEVETDFDDHTFQAVPLADALFYELHVGTFTPEGTYASAAEHLDHLAALGVTHIELMPVATFGGRVGWGYDGVDLFAPHPPYGTPDDLKRFVARCHARGFAVILDVVYNHLGPAGNHLHEFGPYFTERYPTPWGSAINLDGPDSYLVRRFLIDNACMWLERYRFDGLRLDAVHALFDQSVPHFLSELGDEVHALGARLGKPLCLIAESERNDPRLVRTRAAGGCGLDAHWNDDFHHALHAVLTGETDGYYAEFGALEHLARALRDGYVRDHGDSLGDISGDRLLAYLQNHDQIGNRAHGDRISQLVTPGLVRIGAALVFVSPFVPMLFQGEEWAASTNFLYFADHHDPELADAIRRGRREEFKAFGWKPEQIPDPLAESTYRASILDWSELDKPPHRETLQWYQALARLRRELPELRDGRRDQTQVHFDEARRLISVQRGGLTLQANLGQRAAELTRPPGELRLSYPEPPAISDKTAVLEPESCAIWR